MDVLVLGGSVFVGPAVVAEALAAGARVTVFNRGKSGPTPEGAEQVVGDRTVLADLEQLAGRRFDLVVDTAGYVPAEVTLAARLLAPSCGHYVFVSTINVFPGWPLLPDFHTAGVYDGDPDATRTDAPDPETAYGWLKAGCELAVVRAFGAARSTVLRAGCIVGPDDSQVGRLPWWIARVGRGGRVLSPGDQSDQVSLIDARDLARFALLQAPGTFELGGAPVARGELFSVCRDVTGSDARFAWVDASWLAQQGVEEWTEIPLWSTAPSVFLHDSSAAFADGLRCRPLRDTVADTWAWQQRVPGGWRPAQRTPGLDPDKEATLLAAWDAR
ncbi:MAG TPA: NAD-dependent epimerase/dehydratase family protein [Jatrophihabitantaceae bacterium]|jgi:2'-hydroxyisoflavone reductase